MFKELLDMLISNAGWGGEVLSTALSVVIPGPEVPTMEGSLFLINGHYAGCFLGESRKLDVFLLYLIFFFYILDDV